VAFSFPQQKGKIVVKIRQEDNLILTNGNNEKKFTIQASAKAFQILSSALYSRKIEAIIRELSCNAHDSHVQAGCPERPILVHMPNTWEPEFYVEDFGIGLDADDVENIYTSYFTSTKTESNDVIGGFGLGSKTPFSYCDSFNIRARKNGYEYHFNAFINMQGEPATSLISKSETTEPNGVRVTVPVKTTDFNQFNSDAVKVFKWFVVTPEVVGGSIAVDNSKALRLAREGSFWSTYSKDGWERNTITAVMGNVAYHVPGVSETFASHFNPSECAFFKNNTLTVKFDIGELDVAASRETISFDEETEKQFIKRVKEVINQFCADTQAKLDSEVDNVPDAIALVEESVGAWAYDMFTFNSVSIRTLADDNFIKVMNAEFEESTNEDSRLDSYYFAENRRGQVKRHSLDYVGGMTFSKLRQRKIVILQGNDKGFQRVARTLVKDSTGFFGVFFTDVLVEQAVRDELVGIFGDYIEFSVAADLLVIDKAERKAQRDALKALQGPTVRAKAAARIATDSVRVKLFELIADPTTGILTYNYTNEKIVTADVANGKNYLLLQERYFEADVKVARPPRTLVGEPASALDGDEFNHTVATSVGGSMFAFCRMFKIDMLIIVKTPALKKAEKMFGANAIKVVNTYDIDYIRAVTLKYKLDNYGFDVNIKSVMAKFMDSDARRLADEIVGRAERFIESSPNSDLAKALSLVSNLSDEDVYSKLPYNIRFLDHDATFNPSTLASNALATAKTIFDGVVYDYPMIFDSEDVDYVNQYVQHMDKLRELNVFIEKEVQKDEEFLDDEE
jgi:hypothetical protein